MPFFFGESSLVDRCAPLTTTKMGKMCKNKFDSFFNCALHHRCSENICISFPPEIVSFVNLVRQKKHYELKFGKSQRSIKLIEANINLYRRIYNYKAIIIINQPRLAKMQLDRVRLKMSDILYGYIIYRSI